MRKCVIGVERSIGRVEFWDQRIGRLANLEIGAPYRTAYNGEI
jgi:hypothetical protein